MFKPKQTWTYLTYLILIVLKSVGIYLRLVCGLYTTLYLVLTKKVICFQPFFGQTQERQICSDCLAYLCWSPDSWGTHCVIFLWVLFSPSVKGPASTRCCLTPLLTEPCEYEHSHYQLPFQPGCVFYSGRVLCDWVLSLPLTLMSWKSLLLVMRIGVNQRTVELTFHKPWMSSVCHNHLAMLSYGIPWL